MKKLNWRVPTKEELDLMHKNLHKKGIGGFAFDYYWSSSKYYANFAWYQNFYFGYQYYYNKTNYFRVRAVRDFESVNNYQVGDKTTTGIVFWKEWSQYRECKFEDEYEKYNWDKAMNLFKSKKKDIVEI